MPKGFIGNLASLSLDSKFASALLKKKSNEALKAGAKAWVLAALTEIPSWSGASRAALTHIADIVGVPVPITIHPNARPPKGPGNRVAWGKAHSLGALRVEGGKFTLEFSAGDHHLGINENHDATQWGFRLKKPGPYNFRDKANAAFNAEVRRVFSGFFTRLISRSLRVTTEKLG